VAGNWGGPVDDVDVVGNLAYLANGRMLRIINIADPAHPAEVGNIDLGAVSGVRVRNGFAFVAAVKPYRFSVVDVSNPAQPKLGGYDNTGTAGSNLRDVRLYGNVAYVYCIDTQRIGAFDITDPHNVISRGNVPTVVLSGPQSRADAFSI